MKGLPNLGATCWLNAIIQCLREVREWNEVSEDPFTSELLKLLKYESDNTTNFLKELPMNPFGDGPNDSQEALLYVLDRLERTINLSDFTGQLTQTVVYPKGRSVCKVPFTVWFKSNEKDDVIDGYTDAEGHSHRVSIVQRTLTKLPKILISDSIEEEMYGKKIRAIVHWGFGHYVAFVKDKKDDSWWSVSDSLVTKATPILKGYIGFYT